MDLSQRRTFVLGSAIAAIAGLSIGLLATRDDPAERSTAAPRAASTAAPSAPRTVPPHTRGPTPPSTPSCLLEDAPSRPSPFGLPQSSGSIVLASDHRAAALADTDADTVVMLSVDVATPQILSRFTTQGAPTHVLLSADGRAFVTERRSASVSVYDPRTGRRLCTTRVPSDPFAMALSPDGETLYVTSAISARLTAIDTRTLRERWSVDTPREPRAIALNRSGTRAFLSHIAGAPVSAFELGAEGARALTVPAVPIPIELQRVALPMDDGDLDRFDPTIPLVIGGTPQRVSSRSKRTIAKRILRTQRFITQQVRPVPSQAWSLVALHEDDTLVVPFMVNRTGRELPPIVRLDAYGGGSVSAQRQNEKVTFALAVLDANNLQWKSFVMPNGVQALVRGARRGSRARLPSTLSHAVRIPIASAHDPSARSLIVASLGTSEIASVPLSPRGVGVASVREGDLVSSQFGGRIRPTPTTVGIIPTLNDPRAEHSESVAFPSGVAVTRDGVRLTYSQFEHSVEVSKGENSTRITVGSERLAPDVARGRRLFYTANNGALSSGGLSCGGCHPDGRDDGLVWFLAHGPRQTPTLAGRLVAPFNWTGSHRTIEGNVAQTITRLGGTGLPISDVDAIAAFVQRGIDAPSPEPPARAPSSDLVARGREVFMGAGNCASCHDPARNFTDGQAHELGGLGSDERERRFDTPSLRFLRGTGPFFHDGRYQTLRELLTDGRARMGTIGSLAAQDVDALEAFLLTL